MRNGDAGDHDPMTCDSVRAELSAALDGEQTMRSEAWLAEHLAGCADCRAWQDAAHRLTRRVRLTPARVIPDRAPQILAAVLADRAARRGPDRGRRLARIGLVAAAFAQAVIVLPALVMGHAGIGVSIQASHELGAFNLALAVGFAAAALRPSLARGMLPLVGTATATLVVVAVIDTVYGQTEPVAELPHLIAVVGWLLLHLLFRNERRNSGGPDTSATTPRGGRWGFRWRAAASAGGLWAGISAAAHLQPVVRSRPAPSLVWRESDDEDDGEDDDADGGDVAA